MNEENRSEGIEQIKQKFIHPDAESFNIKRAPKYEIEIFKEFANHEFLGDYGMAFKELIQEALIKPREFEIVLDMLEDHEKRMLTLEGKQPTEQQQKGNIRKTLSGRIIKWEKKKE